MSNELIDTNILYDYFDEKKEAIELLDNINPLVFRGAIYELFNLLKNNFGSIYASDIVKNYFYNSSSKFQVIESISQDEELALVFVKFHESKDSKKNFSLVDCIQVAIAQRLNTSLLTTEERLTTYFTEVKQPYSHRTS